MKHKAIHISIPTPCHESWASMDATECGAFCHSCRKEVIDFSAMTDREVIEYLSKNKTGCGRFRSDQLETKLSMPTLDNGFMKWKALFLSLLPLFSFRATFAANPDLAQKPASQQKSVAKENIPSKIMVTGIVSNEAGAAIREAVVEVVDSTGEYIGPSAMLEQDGCFSITLDGQTVQQGARLKIIAAADLDYRSEIQLLNYEPFQQYAICLSAMVCEVNVTKTQLTSGKNCTMGLMVVETTERREIYNSPFLDLGFEFPAPNRGGTTRFGRKDY